MRLEEGTVTATVMITDMVGSTRLRAEQGDDVADLVRRRHDRIVRRAVERSRGAVVKGTGDGILASFGAASDAVAAAVEVQQQLTAEGPAEGRRTPVSVRVGLAAGDVTWEAGDCFGMPVVEAARLESEAAGGEILATELVRLLAGGRGGHRFEPLGERLVRGVPHPITISRVEWTPRAGGTTPIDCPLPPELVGPPEPLIGREEQLEDLATAWRRVEGGERQLVLVSGEPGVGKTRLLRAMALEVTDAGGLVLFGSWERDGGSSYRPFARALGWLTEHLADGDRAAMVRGRAELGALVPSLIPDGAGPPGPGSVDRLPLFDAVAATLRELAGRQPVCLILDDLHWADRSSLGLIEHLTAASAGCRLAIVLAHREAVAELGPGVEDFLAQLARRAPVTRIALVGLSDEEVLDLIEAEAGRAAIDGRPFAEQIRRFTSGNPFLVGEVWRHLVRSRAVTVGDAGWTGRAEDVTGVLPAGANHVISQRLTQIQPSTRELLEAGSVSGERFSLRSIGGVLGRSLDELAPCIQEAEAHGLIDAGGGGVSFGFRHALVRAVVYENLGELRRAMLHRDLGRAVLAESDPPPADRLAQLAHHFALAAGLDCDEQAIRFGRLAAAHAMRRAAFEEADALLARVAAIEGVDDHERCDVLLELGEARRLSGDIDGALETFQEAAALARDIGDPAREGRAAIGYESTSWRPGLPGESAVNLLERVLPRLTEGERLHTLAMAGLARALTFSGRPERAQEVADRAAAAARAAGDPGTLAAALRAGSWAPWGVRSEIERQIPRADEVRRVGLEAGDLESIAHGQSWLLMAQFQLGRVDVLRSEAEQHRRICEDTGQLFFAHVAACLESALALFDGRLEDAESLADQAREIGERQRGLDVSGLYGMQMFTIRREQDRLREVAPVVRLVASGQAPGGWWGPGLAAIYAELGMLAEAAEVLEKVAVDEFAAIPHDALRCASLAFLSDACCATGSRRHATVLQRLIAPWAGLNLTAGGAFASFGATDRLLGALAHCAGRRSEAIRHLDRALELNLAMRSATWTARTETELAAVLQDGDAAERSRAGGLLEAALRRARRYGLAASERHAKKVLAMRDAR